MRKFKKVIAFVCSTAIAALSVLPTSGLAVTPADVEAKDPNGDGVITMADVAFMYQILSGKYNPSDLTRFDIDDNDVVSDVDAIYTQMYTAGMLSNSVSPTPDADSSSIMAAETSSTSRNYQVYNAQTGAYLRNYSLEVENFDSTYNARQIIGDNEQDTDWSNEGVAKIMCDASEYGVNYRGTGFVVGRHTIATAAHVVYRTTDNHACKLTEIRLFDENGSSTSFTPVEYHIPVVYKNYTQDTADYDYALITVEEDLANYMTFNLGLITDNAIANNLSINTTGFPDYNPNVKMTSNGIITTDISASNYVFSHNADTSGGNSGSPIYLIETVNGKTYNTVVGIHRGWRNNYNVGVRFTPHLLKFLKGNSNIQY